MTIAISNETKPENLTWLVGHLLHSYWGWWLSEERIREGVKNSLCFWVYDGETPVAFARIVTDKAMFSSVVDLFVIEEYQGQGVGRKLMEAILDHPDVKHTVCILATRDAAAFYCKFGFELAVDPVLKKDPI